MKRSIIAAVFSLGVILIAAPAPAAVIKVAATIAPLADMVRQIGGDRVAVVTILTAGASEHSFEPSSSQMRKIADASLHVRVGAGMDRWADRLFATATPRPPMVTVTDGIKLLSLADQELLHEESSRHHDEVGGGDPHVWLDPLAVRDRIVPAITGALVKLSPADADLFRTNARRFTEELTRLDNEFREGLRPIRNRNFIALHSAWAYLAKRYGLRQVASVEPFPGREPSARYLTELVKLARSQQVGTIFAEPQLSDKAARVIAAELKGKVLLLDPLGGETVRGRETYLSLMRYNLGIIRGGMR